MLTVIGFIEQENWMYATRADDDFPPGYNNTSRSLKTLSWNESLPASSAGVTSKEDKFFIQLAETYRWKRIKRKRRERREACRKKWELQQRWVNLYQQRQFRRKLKEGALLISWLNAWDKYLIRMEFQAYRYDERRTRKIDSACLSAEFEAYMIEEERNTKKWFRLKRERGKRTWQESVDLLCETAKSASDKKLYLSWVEAIERHMVELEEQAYEYDEMRTKEEAERRDFVTEEDHRYNRAKEIFKLIREGWTQEEALELTN